MGHSMGGLLAAQAATDLSNTNLDGKKRIVGMIAFDCPYLGMYVLLCSAVSLADFHLQGIRTLSSLG